VALPLEPRIISQRYPRKKCISCLKFCAPGIDVAVKRFLSLLTIINYLTSFANRSRCFMDAYEKGLNGCEAVWAARKYHSHRIIPESLMAHMEKAKMQ